MEKSKRKEIRAVITARGHCALWEKGGRTSTEAGLTGFSQIITNSIGNPLIPIFVRSKGMIENSNHALFPVNKGFTIITVHDAKELTIEIKSIMEIVDTMEPCPFNEAPSLNAIGFKCKLCGTEYLPYDKEYAKGLPWESIHPVGFVPVKQLIVETIHYFSNGKWDITPPDWLENAIKAAESKAACFNCRESHYMVHGYHN